MPQALLDGQEQEHLFTRLVTRYAGVHSPERIRAAIAEVYARFAEARVHAYIPLLAERAVRDLLEADGTSDRTVTRPVRSERGRPG